MPPVAGARSARGAHRTSTTRCTGRGTRSSPGSGAGRSRASCACTTTCSSSRRAGSSSRISRPSRPPRPPRPPRAATPRCSPRAVGLFGGELLPEERFEDWAIDRREAVKATYVELLLELADIERGRSRLDAAIDALKRLVAVEPLHEDAQAQLIQLHGLAGRRHLAVAHFERFRTLLRSELDAEPLPGTVAVYRSVCPGGSAHRPAVTADLAPLGRRVRGERAAPALGLHR